MFRQMSNFNEDRRQVVSISSVNHTEIIGKIKNIYIVYSIKITGVGDRVEGVVIIIVTAQIIDVYCISSVSGIELEDLLLMS